MERKSKRLYKRIFCEHCSMSLCKSTWYKHYTQYCNPRTKISKKTRLEDSQDTAGDSVSDLTDDGSSDDSQQEVYILSFAAELVHDTGSS